MDVLGWRLPEHIGSVAEEAWVPEKPGSHLASSPM